MKRSVSVAEAEADLPALVHEAEKRPVTIERRRKRVAIVRPGVTPSGEVPARHQRSFGAGSRKDAVRAHLYETVLPTTLVLPYDARAAEVHGAERARLERLGRAPTFADGQIAGVAIANALVLVTANAKDFTRFDGLVVENWLA